MGKVSGSVLDESEVYQIDLDMQGSYFFENDSTGSQYDNNFIISGHVKTNEISCQIQQYEVFHLVHSKGTTVTNSISNQDSSMDWKGQKYHLSGG